MFSEKNGTVTENSTYKYIPGRQNGRDYANIWIITCVTWLNVRII